MANNQNLKPWQPGQSGNPLGKPKGTKHLSTWIQDLLPDSRFQAFIAGPEGKAVKCKGAPIQVMNTIYLTENN